MIESVVALLMFVNAEIKEARLQENMAACLRGKRHAERQFSESVTYKCCKGWLWSGWRKSLKGLLIAI